MSASTTQTLPFNLILLPGIYGTGRMYGPLIDALPEYYDPLVIPYPTQQVLSYTQLAEHVLQQIPADKPCVVLAESFSGPIGLYLMQLLGERMRGLILVCSFIKNPHPLLSVFSRLVLHDRWLQRPPKRWLVKYFVAGFDVNESMLDLAYNIQQMVSPLVFRHRLQQAMKIDVSALLRQANIPLLHLYARHDRVIPASAQRNIRQVRPDIETLVYDGPHYLLQTRPEQCVPDIMRFIESL